MGTIRLIEQLHAGTSPMICSAFRFPMPATCCSSSTVIFHVHGTPPKWSMIRSASSGPTPGNPVNRWTWKSLLSGVPHAAVTGGLVAIAFRGFVGALLALWCPVMLLSGRLPRFGGGRLGDGLAGAVGGLMGPLGGFTGAIPTLWCTLRGYKRDAQRAVIQNFNLAMLAVTMVSYVAGGVVTRPMWPLMAIVAPALLLPALLGMKVYIGISPLAFRNVVLGLLTLSGVAMLGSALMAR